MPIYIFHMAIVEIINNYLCELPMKNKIVVYYLGTILFATIAYCAVEKAKWLMKKKYNVSCKNI